MCGHDGELVTDPKKTSKEIKDYNVKVITEFFPVFDTNKYQPTSARV